MPAKKTAPRKIGRPRIGETPRVVFSARVEPATLKWLTATSKKTKGGAGAFLDQLAAEAMALKREAHRVEKNAT